MTRSKLSASCRRRSILPRPSRGARRGRAGPVTSDWCHEPEVGDAVQLIAQLNELGGQVRVLLGQPGQVGGVQRLPEQHPAALLPQLNRPLVRAGLRQQAVASAPGLASSASQNS